MLDRSSIDFGDMNSIASTTFSKMMEGNDSVALDDPYLYYEIQHLNKYHEDILWKFDLAVHDVVEATFYDDQKDFKDLMDKGMECFT